jgi:hypothetical protein
VVGAEEEALSLIPKNCLWPVQSKEYFLHPVPWEREAPAEVTAVLVGVLVVLVGVLVVPIEAQEAVGEGGEGGALLLPDFHFQLLEMNVSCLHLTTQQNGLAAFALPFLSP